MRKNIIISCVGDGFFYNDWFHDKREYDICYIYYGNSNDISNRIKDCCDYFFIKKGFKFKLIKKIIDENHKIFNNYDYYWLPDDDLKISFQEINKLFKIAHKYCLDICQPAMTGFVSHVITMPSNNGNILKFTNFVEILAPLFNKKSINLLKDTFSENDSAAGLDLIWPKLIGDNQKNLAVIDSVIMNHTRPIGIMGYGRYPVHPNIEIAQTCEKYGLSHIDFPFKIYEEVKEFIK